MKKIIVSILTVLISLQVGSTNSYAKCDIENLRLRDVDFTEIIDGEKAVTQTVGDKEVTVTRLEDFL